MQKLKALIFDFDGLILDTESAEVEVWEQIYSEHGVEFPILKWVTIVGGRGAADFEAADYLCEKAGGLEPEKLRERFLEERMNLIHQLDIMAGVSEILKGAKDEGVRLALASSSPRVWIDEHLERLGLSEIFEVICTRDDVEITKPNPSLFLLGAKRLGVKADEVVVLEDSYNGVLAAKAAGMCVVAVPNRVTAHTDLSSADLVLDSLAQINVVGLAEELEKTT